MPTTTDQTSDVTAFKKHQRAQSDRIAAGWSKWSPVIEVEEFGGAMSRTLVELARLRPGDHVLDVAAGYGEPGLTAARAVRPGGQVVCTDLSPEMLALGRDRAARAGLDNLEFVECDAEALAFRPETFDAVLSRTGLQFLPDVAGTLRRLHDFLRPDGRLVAMVWGAPPAVPFATAFPVIVRELDLPAPPAGPGPFALADADRLGELVEAAGFEGVETDTLTVVLELDTAEDFTRFVRDAAPINELLEDHPREVQERVWRKVTEAYAAFQTPGGRVRTENEAIWVRGAKR